MTQRHDPRGLIVRALVLAGMGVLLAWEAQTRSPRLHVPPLVGYLVAMLLFAGAFRLVQLVLHPQSTGDAFAVVFSAGAATLGGWIALGSGERLCSVRAGAPTIGTVSALGCRVPFGVGALLMIAVTVFAAVHWLRTRQAVAPADDQLAPPLG